MGWHVASADLIGNKYGRLTVVSFVGIKRGPKRTQREWLCRCDCGTKVTATTNTLRMGHTKSCGCLKADAIRKAMTTHGGSVGYQKSTEYRTWLGIIKRCCNPNAIGYANYGARGIAICPEWRHDFAAFFAHVGPKPSPAHAIDRIDNNRGYEPGNVRWATRREQGLNQRDNPRLTFQGRTMTVTEWAEELGMNVKTLRSRIVRQKWPVEKALTTPVKVAQGG